jgi:hypothetical protein
MNRNRISSAGTADKFKRVKIFTINKKRCLIADQKSIKKIKNSDLSLRLFHLI